VLIAHVGGPVLAPLELAPLALAAILYARRARTLAERGKPVPGWRQWCFHGGLAIIAVALLSPLSHVADELFLAHMAEHLLIADIGALLIVLGLTGPVLAPVLRIRWLGWIRAFAHPLAALPLWAASLYFWHIPGFHEAALESPAVHALQHACFLGLGVLMWMPLFGPLPQPVWFGNFAKLLYIVAVRLIGAVLGNVLVWSGDVAYDAYAPGEAEWDISPLTDQTVAGGIMMVEGSLLTLGLFCWLFLRAAREGEERQELLELAAERGVPLDERRATRAVHAGRGDELRARIEQSAH
jgi:cytochrome c oxidase assembly factor CtaG